MPTTTTSDGVNLYYETHGSADDPTFLLVNGLGSQMIHYEPEFCSLLVDQGFHVVRFDNRDVGLSSKTEAPPPNVIALLGTLQSGGAIGADDVSYRLTDMAADAFAVLDAVGAERAHIAGMSMGGMIVQRMTIDRPDRILSMTSIMSTTGNREVGEATPEAAAVLITPAPADRDGYIEHSVKTRSIISGSHQDHDDWREVAGRSFDRMFHPVGVAHQLAAILADGNRTDQLAALDVPTLVIHGPLDTLIALSGGEATAAAIPGAELLVIDEMGHDLPPEIWDEVVTGMAKVAATAD
ncbi:MAG: alpha/beta hydrolase [Actinomycetota bacterium]